MIVYWAYGHTISIEVISPADDDELAKTLQPPNGWWARINPRGVFCDAQGRFPTLAEAEIWAQAWCKDHPRQPQPEPEVQVANMAASLRRMWDGPDDQV
jgi:hypothetical protein